MVTNNQLLAKKSSKKELALDDSEIKVYLAAITGWALEDAHILKTYAFKNYYQTLAFVNAVAYVIHAENHHPDLTVTFNQCTVSFNTHSVNQGKGGLSENDFICAAKVDAIFEQSAA